MADEKLAPNADSEKDEDAVISMVDYLEEEEKLEEDAKAVLGGSDENQCTYPQGYVQRQALYACFTCDLNDGVPAGVCLACSYACHENHELFELYSKRNFRCDCGNSKFKDLKCKLFQDRAEFNEKNQYNHNFKGLYCVCERPYPDPEDEIEDEMIQCIICEDWYHGRHLGEDKPPTDFSEMICQNCMRKHDFLWAYTASSKGTQVVKKESSDVLIDAGKTDSTNLTASSATSVNKSDSNHSTEKSDSTESDVKTDSSSSADNEKGETTSQEAKAEHSKVYDSNSNIDGACHLAELQKREIVEKNSAVFWPDNFRSKLCRCSNCKQLYKDQGVEFLLDDNDTVMAYEKRGAEKPGSSSTHQDREQQVLNTMNRVQQIEMVQGYNDMKSALTDYLKHFAENGKVVRAEDIQEFFSQMEQRKRQRTNHTPAHFCR